MSDQSRRSRPLGAPPAPRAATPAIAVVVALVAAVLGFFILRQLNNDDGGGSTATPVVEGSDSGSEDQSDASDGSVVAAATLPPTTVPPPVTPGSFKAVVANGSGVGGAAKSLTNQLTTVFAMQMAEPTNILETLPKLDVSEVYFAPGKDAQGAYTANLLGCAFIPKPLPAAAVVDASLLVGVDVLIVQGKDLTTNVLAPCNPAATPAPATPAPAASAAPAETVAPAG
jgi:hypothetical protein